MLELLFPELRGSPCESSNRRFHLAHKDKSLPFFTVRFLRLSPGLFPADHISYKEIRKCFKALCQHLKSRKYKYLCVVLLPFELVSVSGPEVNLRLHIHLRPLSACDAADLLLSSSDPFVLCTNFCS